jgi:hypothetical protein
VPDIDEEAPARAPHQDALDLQRADLEERGYVEIPEHNGYRPGDRVRHVGHHFNYDTGTAEVLAIYEKSPSAWSNKHGARDIEVLVLADYPILAGTPTVRAWANYHTCPVRRD